MHLNLQRLKAERVASGFTQQKVAEALGRKDRGWYAKRESGFVDIGVDEFMEIVGLFGYTADNVAIFFTTDVPKKQRSESA